MRHLKMIIADNGMPDIGADTMFENATEKGTIDTILEIPGSCFGTKAISEYILGTAK